MRDPFSHARVAGLRGLVASQKLVNNDPAVIATKLLPTVCVLLVDPDRGVREAAFELMDTHIKVLREAS